jgi:cardiolipin-specific phospholipase
MPVSFVYGDEDWMDHRHAVAHGPKIKDVRVAVVKYAGHHLYLDNPDAFNNAILNELKDSPAEFVHDVDYVFRK